MFACTFLLFIGAASSIFSTESTKRYYDLENAESHFGDYIRRFNKVYLEEERAMRFEVFKLNLQEVNQRNLEEEHTRFDIQEFSDLSRLEFKEKYTCLVPRNGSDDPVCNVVEAITRSGQAPDEFDWRHKNAVTPVKDQKHCRSCWTFSTTGNVEGQYAIKNGRLLSFSEQQLIDCDKISDGCTGGTITQAMKYYEEIGGAETEDDYPYKHMEQKCSSDMSKIVAKVASCNEYHLSPDNEEDIKWLLYENGPISIAIDSTDIRIYDGGVLKSCSVQTRINHAVLLVGYGTDKITMEPYWLVKNSWGPGWGEDGYYRVKRGGNPCGFINSQMSSVVLAL